VIIFCPKFKQLVNVAIANALQLEAAWATPAPYRFSRQNGSQVRGPKFTKLEVCFSVRMSCFIFKCKRLKVEWCWKWHP